MVELFGPLSVGTLVLGRDFCRGHPRLSERPVWLTSVVAGSYTPSPARGSGEAALVALGPGEHGVLHPPSTNRGSQIRNSVIPSDSIVQRGGR